MLRRTGNLTRYGSAAALLAAAVLAPNVASAQAAMGDKWITIVLPVEPTSLDGCNSSAGTEGRVLKQNIVETLIEKNPEDNSLIPKLAVSWEQIEPKTWRLELREGVVFHDGSPFNAEAVRKSLIRNRSKEIVCRDNVKYVGDFELEPEVVDEHTIDLHTSRVEPILPMRMSGTAIVGPDQPPNSRSRHPVGTGPYAFTEWNSGHEIVLTRFGDYWGEAPEVEGARYIWRDESSVRASMVKVGEADIAPVIAEQDAVDPDIDHSYLNSETAFLRMDMSYPPLNDRRVRLALNYAFNREALLGSVIPEQALHATQMVFPFIPGHNFELDKMVRQYDPEKAKALIAEAKADGVPVDREIVLRGRPAGYPNSTEVMEAALAWYQDIGLNVKLVQLEANPYNDYNYKPFPPDRGPSLLQNMHDNNYGDPVFSVFFRYACDGAVSTLCDEKLDKDVARVTELSGQERIDGWNEIFRYLYEEVVNEVWMYHMVGYARVNPRVDFVPDVTTNSEIHISKIGFN